MNFLLKIRRIALMLCVLFGGTTASVFAQDLPRYEENTLYVKFKDGSEISAKKMLDVKSDTKTIRTAMLGLSNNLMNRFKIEPEALSMSLFDNPILDKTFMISIDPEAKADIEQLMEELEKNPNVEYVERVPFNRIFSTEGERPVNDPYYGDITSNEKTINVSWHLDLINAQKAWELQKGDPELIVAVVDNAIWGAHEDLQIPSTRQYNCVKKEVGNSAPPTEYGIQQNEQCEIPDLYNSSCEAFDFSHGTHCAGAIGAINDNNTGIASIAGGVSLMGVAGPSSQYPSGIMNSYHGLEWAASHGAKIISCSWGSDDFSRSNEAVVKACYEQGIIIIAAVGNDNVSTPHYPAAYYPYVIGVGSVDADRNKSSFSNYGHWVDILSPGGEDTTAYRTQIFSTTYCQNQYTRLFGKIDEFTGKYYDEMSGTSMATPILAGIVALMKSKDATLTTDQVRAILQKTGNNPKNGASSYNSYCKIADAYAALNFLTTSPIFLPSVDSLSAETSHDSVWLTWKAPETTEAIKGYNIYRDGEKIADAQQTYTFLDVNRPSGTIRYAVEPVYENSSTYTARAEINATVKKYFTISALIRPDDSYGYVEGTGQFEHRQIYTLKAIAYDGHHFEYWTDERGEKLFGATLSGPTMQNRRYFAYFAPGNISNEDLHLLKKAVHISPNPAKDEINIQCTDFELQYVRISDMQGRIVYNAGCIDCQTHSLNIAIGSWAKGTYIVQVTTSKGTVSHKLIKR
ncbi:MAG: S8 family serine peptidase [Bacteroidales bacterium]|nr:S8 family serine peptidase [Bacteroidales bacterium]